MRIFSRLILVVIVHLFFCFANGQKQHFPIIEFGVGPTIEKENFRWSIAGNEQGKDPNVLSELIYSPIRSAGFSLRSTIHPIRKLSVSLGYKQVINYAGRATDTDYDSDNRNDIVYFGDFESKTGDDKKVSASVGYVWVDKLYKLSTSIGYLHRAQTLFLTKNNIPELNTSYKTKWTGSTISVNISVPFAHKFSVGTNISYYLYKYNSVANWNINDLFKHPISFKQNAIGNGIESGFILNYYLSKKINVALEGNHFYSKTNKGKDIAYASSGETLYTQFNGAISRNNSLSMFFYYRF